MSAQITEKCNNCGSVSVKFLDGSKVAGGSNGKTYKVCDDCGCSRPATPRPAIIIPKPEERES